MSERQELARLPPHVLLLTGRWGNFARAEGPMPPVGLFC